VTGKDAWILISPLISPMAHDAMNNKEFGEAYVRTYIALKENDDVEELREYIKHEIEGVSKVLNEDKSLANKGYVFTDKDDMMYAAKILLDTLKCIGKMLGMEV
jgi:hypothetical protein